VDEVISEQEPGGFVRHLTARCHGADDRMTITDHDIQNWTREVREFWSAVERGDVEGVAFGQRPDAGAELLAALQVPVEDDNHLARSLIVAERRFQLTRAPVRLVVGATDERNEAQQKQRLAVHVLVLV